MSKETRASRPAVTPFTNKRKPLISKEERARQVKSLITYRPDGGDAS